MPIRKNHPRRTAREIFDLADAIGPDNVMLNDAELGAILATDERPLQPTTIANMRSAGRLDIKWMWGAHREKLSRLSDALRAREQLLRRPA